MPFGFYIIMAAQFFSALADNALLLIAFAILDQDAAPEEHRILLKWFFALFYVALAWGVGAFADSMPKGRVMFLSNTIKIVGCLMFFMGVNPLYSYAVVGLGAAAYSPAKYGILTEYLPHSKLVVANGWIEGLTVLAIISGTVVGGGLITTKFLGWFSEVNTVFLGNTSFGASIVVIGILYILAAVFNLFIPDTGVDHKPLKRNPAYLIHDFVHCLTTLWRDKLGQISLAITTITWGVAHALQIIVLEWAPKALNLQSADAKSQATLFLLPVAVGMASGAVFASAVVSLRNTLRVIPLGLCMGILMLLMPLVHHFWVAIIMLFTIGALGGFFVVPMNALLQHRGHVLLGAGHSIAVQNFNENLSTMVIASGLALLAFKGLGLNMRVIALASFVILSMFAVQMWHRSNQAKRDNEADLDHVN